MPEPEDPSLLTAVDSDAPGYPKGIWNLGPRSKRAQVARWTYCEVPLALGALGFSVIITAFILFYPSIAPLLQEVLPDSEWAYEDTGIRDLQSSGTLGEGVKVCIVDTGIDSNHPDLSKINLVGFRDFYQTDNEEVKDIGYDKHGTLMSGLLVADGNSLERPQGYLFQWL